MKRILSLAFVLVLVLTSLLSCHGSRNTKVFDIPEKFDTEKNYSITFWAKNDTNITQTRIYEKAIADFEEIYPNITVNLRLYTDYGKIYNDVITNIATGTTPNVCITYPDHIATYMTGENTVVPLDDLFSDEKYGLGGSEVRFDTPKASEIIPKFLSECRIGAYHYAVPFMRSTEACYVNKTYVEKLGFTLPDVLTWDFVFEVSDAAAKKDENGNYLVNGQKVMIPFIYKSTDNMMIQMLKQKGAEYSTNDGKIGLFSDTTRDLLLNVAEHVKTGAFSTFKITGYPANFLNAGQCIFAVDSTAGSTWMGTHAPLSDISEDKLVDFETAVMTVPQYDTEHIQMISQGPSVCIFNKEDSQEVLASWLFTQYLLSNDVQIAYSQTEGYVPVTTKARETEEYKSYITSDAGDALHYEVKLKSTQMLLDNVDNTFVTPVWNGSASLRDAAGQLIEDTVKAVRRKKNVDNAFIDGLYDDVTALYRLDVEGKGASSQGKNELGKLPIESVILLTSLAVVWIFMAIYVICDRIRRTKL